MLVWWLAASTTWGLAVFALIFGTCYGGFVALAPAITVDYFGARNASGIIGVLYTGVAVGTLLGPRLAGDAFDLFQSYTLPIAISAGAALAAAAIILVMPEPATWRAAVDGPLK
jgi:MFS family permease